MLYKYGILAFLFIGKTKLVKVAFRIMFANILFLLVLVSSTLHTSDAAVAGSYLV
jgi:hypothetical protein